MFQQKSWLYECDHIFARNHNAIGTVEQDPGVFGPETARQPQTTFIFCG